MRQAEIPQSAIPRTIHYCWFGGAPMSPLGRRCIQTWRDVMPDYRIEAWGEDRLDRSIPYVDMAYRARKFAFVADYVRLQALYEHGGLYFDTDIEVLKRFDELMDEDRMFLGYQAPGSIAVGVIGAVAGHPFLKLVLDALDREAANGGPSFLPLPDLVTTLLNGAVPERPRLLPPDCFYPYNPYSPDPLRQKPLQCNISERTLCIHHWEGTWLAGVSLRGLLETRLKEALRKMQPGWARRPLTSPGLRP